MENYNDLSLNSFMRIIKKYNNYDEILSITLKKCSNGEITHLNDLSIIKFKFVVSKINIRWYWVVSACVCEGLNNNPIITLPQPTSPIVNNHKETHVALPRLTLVKKREKTHVVVLPRSTSPLVSKSLRKNSLVSKGTRAIKIKSFKGRGLK